MSAESVQRTLRRPVSQADLAPAVLRGYRRQWAAKGDVFSETLGRSITAVFLDIEPCAEMHINGVLTAVSASDLERVREREQGYACVDVTHLVETGEGGGAGEPLPIVTFVCEPQHRVTDSDTEVYVMREYTNLVERAIETFGAEFALSYRVTTPAPPFPFADGPYRSL